MTGIGASDAPAVMDSSPFMTSEELWARKTERMLPQKSTPQMRRGKDLEAVARKVYEEMTGIPMPAAFIQNEKYPFAIASPDGLSIRSERVLEIKCPGETDHKVALSGKIPRKYLWQCVHLCLVTGMERCDYFSFDGKNGVIVEFKRDPKLEAELIEAEKIFWGCVLKDTAPEKKVSIVSKQEFFKVRRFR